MMMMMMMVNAGRAHAALLPHRHVFDGIHLTFAAVLAFVDLVGVFDVAMATFAVEGHALGVILRLADEKSFHVFVDDGR